MRFIQIQEVRQQQTQRIDPRQILASEILAWTTEEAEAAIEREVEENPALEFRESEELPPLARLQERPALVQERASSFSAFPGTAEGPAENSDPFERVPSNISLREHLRGQVGQVGRGVSAELLRYHAPKSFQAQPSTTATMFAAFLILLFVGGQCSFHLMFIDSFIIKWKEQ